MKALALLACSGCATSWGLAHLGNGGMEVLDERTRDVAVPRAGVDERLAITMPVAIEHEMVPGKNGVLEPGPAKPFALACSLEQHATSTIYHSAFRYDRSWKKATATFFLIEAATATFMLLTANADRPDNYLTGGFLAADAAITGVLFFAPRQEIYTEHDQPVVTPIRTDCPDGLTLEIGAESFPVDAAGSIGDLGVAALDEWMMSPRGAITARLGERAEKLPIGFNEICAYRYEHAHEQCSRPGGSTPRVTFVVAPGTFALPPASLGEPSR